MLNPLLRFKRKRPKRRARKKATHLIVLMMKERRLLITSLLSFLFWEDPDLERELKAKELSRNTDSLTCLSVIY